MVVMDVEDGRGSGGYNKLLNLNTYLNFRKIIWSKEMTYSGTKLTMNTVEQKQVWQRGRVRRKRRRGRDTETLGGNIKFISYQSF